MKKPITLFLLSSAVFFIVSCNKKRDWTCTCMKDGAVVYKTVAHDAKKKGEKAAAKKWKQKFREPNANSVNNT